MLKAWVHQQLVLEDSHVIIENFGNIFIRCNEHKHPAYIDNRNEGKKNKNDNFLEVEYRNIEILDLDTTTAIF